MELGGRQCIFLGDTTKAETRSAGKQVTEKLRGGWGTSRRWDFRPGGPSSRPGTRASGEAGRRRCRPLRAEDFRPPRPVGRHVRRGERACGDGGRRSGGERTPLRARDLRGPVYRPLRRPAAAERSSIARGRPRRRTHRERPPCPSSAGPPLSRGVGTNSFPAVPFREGRELRGSVLTRPRLFPPPPVQPSPALLPAAFAPRACARPSFFWSWTCLLEGCARAPSPCCVLVSPWARAGLRVHGTQSRGPSRGDGGDGESRDRSDGREAPYLP